MRGRTGGGRSIGDVLPSMSIMRIRRMHSPSCWEHAAACARKTHRRVRLRRRSRRWQAPGDGAGSLVRSPTGSSSPTTIPGVKALGEIRRQILKGCPDAEEIGDRAEAIGRAIRSLWAGDVLLVAGKGHETGQIIGSRVLPFDDVEIVRAARPGPAGDDQSAALWTSEAAAVATRLRTEGFGGP